jgi:hypothetical protein
MLSFAIDAPPVIMDDLSGEKSTKQSCDTSSSRGQQSLYQQIPFPYAIESEG